LVSHLPKARQIPVGHRKSASFEPARRTSKHLLQGTADDAAEAPPFLAAFESNALTGQAVVVSQGWFMQ
jgi:hypothetical protein